MGGMVFVIPPLLCFDPLVEGVEGNNRWSSYCQSSGAQWVRLLSRRIMLHLLLSVASEGGGKRKQWQRPC